MSSSKTYNSSASLETLPIELFPHILASLSRNDTASFSYVSRAVRDGVARTLLQSVRIRQFNEDRDVTCLLSIAPYIKNLRFGPEVVATIHKEVNEQRLKHTLEKLNSHEYFQPTALDLTNASTFVLTQISLTLFRSIRTLHLGMYSNSITNPHLARILRACTAPLLELSIKELESLKDHVLPPASDVQAAIPRTLLKFSCDNAPRCTSHLPKFENLVSLSLGPYGLTYDGVSEVVKRVAPGNGLRYLCVDLQHSVSIRSVVTLGRCLEGIEELVLSRLAYELELGEGPPDRTLQEAFALLRSLKRLQFHSVWNPDNWLVNPTFECCRQCPALEIVTISYGPGSWIWSSLSARKIHYSVRRDESGQVIDIVKINIEDLDDRTVKKAPHEWFTVPVPKAWSEHSVLFAEDGLEGLENFSDSD